MRHQTDDETLTFWLEGRITAENADEVDRQLTEASRASGTTSLRLDASGLSYISSAGLRVVVKCARSFNKVTVENASPEVYSVFEISGLSMIVEVRRAPREVDLEGMRQIGAGAFGRVYRMDAERVVKVYDPAVYSLEYIERERAVARQAFIHGIPSAIPFETVRAGKESGIVYELIDARTMGEAVSQEPSRCEEWGRRMAALAHTLHATQFEEGTLPDARRIFFGWVDRAEASGLHADATIARLREFVGNIPAKSTFVHGDFHPANVMVMPDEELLLIDMGDASAGHPAIDLAGAYHVMRVAAKRPGGARRLCGMEPELLERFWDAFLRAYFCVGDDAAVRAIERSLSLAALPRTMGSNARSRLIDDEERTRKAAQLERTFLEHCGSVNWDDMLV